MPAVIVLADIDVVIIAFIALILLWNRGYLLKLIAQGLGYVLNHVPVIGGQLNDTVQAYISDFESWAEQQINSWADDVTEPIYDAMDAFANNQRLAAYSQRTVMLDVMTAIQWLAIHGTSQVLSGAQDYTTGSFSQVTTWVQQSLSDLQRNISAAFTQTYSDIEHWTEQNFQAIGSNVSNIVSTTTTNIVNTNTYVQNTASDIGQWTSTQLHDLEVQTAQDLQTAEANLDQRITDAYNQLATSIVQTQDYVEGIIGNVAATEAAAVAAVGLNITANIIPRILDIEKAAEECWQPTCDNLGDLAKGFKDFESLLTLGALFAFIAAAIANPEGSAAAVAGVAETVLSLPEQALSSFFHVAR